MAASFVFISIALLAGFLGFLLAYFARSKPIPIDLSPLERALEKSERSLKDEFYRVREESQSTAKGLREEMSESLQRFREEIQGSFKTFNDSILKTVSNLSQLQQNQFQNFSLQLKNLTESNEKRLEALRAGVEDKLRLLQEDNSQKLEKMRLTVDEKLQGTLEKRLGESFKLVSERLEQVHKGLGEMQNLASGVGDLKRVLTNVKSRGTWGEIQLSVLLEQVLIPEQYAKNVQTKPGSGEFVEFAIKLPARDGDPSHSVWLPIDSKFPQEDYQRLVDAQDKGDRDLAEAAAKQLDIQIKLCGKNIAEKYLSPPDTIDFGIMFLPTEGLYAEVLRRPGLVDHLQRVCRIVIAGPTTLAAILNSIQMGFKTLAIEKRSSEVWKILGAVKSEFGKFGEILDKVHKKLGEASDTIETAARKTRTIERRLRSVEELPSANLDPERLLDVEHPIEPDPSSPTN